MPRARNAQARNARLKRLIQKDLRYKGTEDADVDTFLLTRNTQLESIRRAKGVTNLKVLERRLTQDLKVHYLRDWIKKFENYSNQKKLDDPEVKRELVENFVWNVVHETRNLQRKIDISEIFRMLNREIRSAEHYPERMKPWKYIKQNILTSSEMMGMVEEILRKNPKAHIPMQ